MPDVVGAQWELRRAWRAQTSTSPTAIPPSAYTSTGFPPGDRPSGCFSNQNWQHPLRIEIIDAKRETPLAGRDLAALGRFRLLVQSREKQISLQRAGCQRELAVRKTAMLEARRRCRLLERLKERRLAEWTLARDRELEEVASESYLARWARRRA